MPQTYVKTGAGQREIRERAHPLARASRTLLVLADGAKNADQLLAMVQGSTAQDLATLQHLGLLEEVAPPARNADVPQPATGVPQQGVDVPATADAQLGFKDLYESMTQLVKSQLGLVKAFKYTLDIEKAASVPELLEIARRFAAEVEAAKGEGTAKMIRRALGLPD